MVKSIKLSSVLFAVLATIFVGCSKDDDNPTELNPTALNPTALNPTISFVYEGEGYYIADAKVDSGATVKVKIIAQKGSEGAKLKQFKLVKKVTGANETVVDSTLSSASDSTFNYTFSGSIVTSPTTLEFTITDKDGKSATKSIKFTTKTKPNVKTLNFTSTLVFFNGSDVIDSVTASTNPSTAYFRYYNSQATGTTLISAAQLATAAYQTTPIYTPWATASAEFRTLPITFTDSLFQAAKNEDKSRLTYWFNLGTKTVADSNNPAGTRAKNLTSGQFLGINAGGVIWIAKVTATSQTSLALEVLY